MLWKMIKNQIKNLVLDCDGVLYPLNELNTKQIVEAMKYVYRFDVGLMPEEQKFVSAKTLTEKHLGMFNYIKEICNYKNYDFNTFCQSIVNKTDYSKILKNKPLWHTLQSLKNQYNICIFTNNSRQHLDAVVQKVFNKTLEEVEQTGIKAYDIRATEYEGYFYPKQHEKGFSLFLKNLNFKPEETLLFDDAPVNIERAKSIGMHAALISQENHLLKELQKYNVQNSRIEKSYE